MMRYNEDTPGWTSKPAGEIVSCRNCYYEMALTEETPLVLADGGDEYVCDVCVKDYEAFGT